MPNPSLKENLLEIPDYIESVLLPGFIISVKAIFDAEENALTIQKFLTNIKE